MHEAAWDRQSEASLALCVCAYALMMSSMSASRFTRSRAMQIKNTSNLPYQVSWIGMLAYDAA